MVAGSLLPVSIYKNKLYFLFGKENSMEDSSKGWSDFGGGMDSGETPFTTALREGGEELTGFLGDSKSLQKTIKDAGGVYKISHNDYHVHIFFMEYDENLPKYYNANHQFLWQRMNKKLLNDSKLFEKIEIGWFSVADMISRKKEFRNFYQEIVDIFIEKQADVSKFIRSRKSRKTHKKTLKNGHTA
jgi:8-oxo-dGTP pyrophosphatase MutT (NUDIX family)